MNKHQPLNFFQKWLKDISESEWVLFWWAITKDDVRECQIRLFFDWEVKAWPTFHTPDKLGGGIGFQLGIAVDIPYSVYRSFSQYEELNKINLAELLYGSKIGSDFDEPFFDEPEPDEDEPETYTYYEDEHFWDCRL